MILYQGEIYNNEQQTRLISSLKEDMYLSLQKNNRPTTEMVIEACHRLYQRVLNHEFDQVALPLLASLNMPFSALERYATYFPKMSF